MQKPPEAPGKLSTAELAQIFVLLEDERENVAQMAQSVQDWTSKPASSPYAGLSLLTKETR